MYRRTISALRQLRAPYWPPLLHWSLALIIGAALVATDAALWIAALATAGSTALAVGSMLRSDLIGRRRLPALLLALTPVILGLGIWRAESTAIQSEGLAAADFNGQHVRIVGRVAEEPQFRGSGTRVLLQTESISLASEQREVEAQVSLFIPDALDLELGERIEVEATLTPVASVASEASEYLEWLEAQGIAASGLARPGSVHVLEDTALGWPSRWTQGWTADAREALNVSLRDALPPPISGLAQGMITGRRDGIDTELRSVLNDTSLSHLIVISGSNLTLLTSIVIAATAWIAGRRPAAALAIVAALSYGLLIGPDPPVQRAMWMAIVFAAAHLLGRGASALYAVAATAALLTALDPQILLDLSFQLTLAGTLGIVLLMPTLSRDFLSGQSGFTGAVRDASLVTLVASLTTLPLIALHFERAALIGIPANLLVAPFFSWMLIGSAATAALGLVWESAAQAAAWPLSWLPLRWLVLVAEGAAELPGAGASIRGFGHAHVLIIYGAIGLAAWRPHHERILRWRRPRRAHLKETPHALGFTLIPRLREHLTAIAVTGAASAAAAILWLTVSAAPDALLKVHFFDIGQGDAALIVTADRQTILIDTGEQPDLALAALRRQMPPDSTRIDLLVITHPQSDHAEALWAIFDHYDISQALISVYMQDTSLGRRLLDLLARHEVEVTVSEPGLRIAFPGSTPLHLDVLWPPTSGLALESVDDPNATSIVIRATYGDAAFLFTGDINAAQEIDLVRRSCPGSVQPCDMRSDVLKVAHQGSRFSTTALMLDAVRPTLAVISAGRDNTFGHPHPEVVALLSRLGIETLVTAEHGDISVFTDGRSISVTHQ